MSQNRLSILLVTIRCMLSSEAAAILRSTPCGQVHRRGEITTICSHYYSSWGWALDLVSPQLWRYWRQTVSTVDSSKKAACPHARLPSHTVICPTVRPSAPASSSTSPTSSFSVLRGMFTPADKNYSLRFLLAPTVIVKTLRFNLIEYLVIIVVWVTSSQTYTHIHTYIHKHTHAHKQTKTNTYGLL